MSRHDEDLGEAVGVKHDIDVGDTPPIRKRAYRIAYSQRDWLRQKLDEMLKANIISPSSSPWRAPIILVPKKGGNGTRLVVDYRALNAVTKPDHYPLPRIDETLNALQGCAYFSHCDCTSGFWQIGLTERAKELTSFVTPFGAFKFERAAMGLQGAPATYQRCMDNVLRNLSWDVACCYMDDLVIMAPTWKEHLHRLSLVLTRLRENSLKIKPKKCYFGYPEIAFLGHRVGKDGIATDPEKVSAIQNMQYTSMQTQKDIRSFLGMTGYYHKYIPAYAHIAAPLTDLTKKDLKYSYEEHWTEHCIRAFETLKDLLCKAPILAYPDFNQPFILKTDASNVAVGAALVQWDHETQHERPIAFASRKLNGNEPSYASQEREALAVVWAIKYFRPYLYGHHFTVMTDHRSLQSLPKAYEKGNSRIHRWSVLSQHHSYDVVWKPGRENGDADALSRVQATHWYPLPRLHAVVTPQDMERALVSSLSYDTPLLTLQAFRDAQRQDPQLSAYVTYFLSTDGTLPDDAPLAEEIRENKDRFDLINGVLMRLPDHSKRRTRSRRRLRLLSHPRFGHLYSSIATIHLLLDTWVSRERWIVSPSVFGGLLCIAM
ncbi:unnamed protein product [Vitrella brassicaformis CCMP3155]|uniref:Reverse transcriptase domain-containing protein n=1 Tax=Vitrella brassicaformis (strain CCMP3155) TaxID=1169540 RepID=A0A0G4GJ03_VITBC|nr:unnamed protein product [Vitrella brassicaformis CCMP3155]|eukprot:CEM29809.1 unnamed protein product [Vitrella brassicaformis CCMP3155]